MRIAIFTDNDFEKVNGVTTTLRAVTEHIPEPWHPRVYTTSGRPHAERRYFSTASVGVGLPWYREMRIYWPRIEQLVRELRKDDVDLIHLTTPGPMGLAARWLARRTGLPLVGSYHTHLGEYINALSGSARLAGLMDDYMRWLYGACQSILVPSRATADLLVGAGFHRDRLRIWPRGVDAEQFSPSRLSASLRHSWGVNDQRPAILYVGRLSGEKGLALISPIQRALHRRGIPHRFIFVGDGPMADSLRRDCPDGVFLGNVPHDQVAVAMASSDMFLFPSATDAFGNVILESHAAGLPAVVTDRGGPAEHVIEGTTGFICPAGDADAFSARVIELLRAPSRRAAMGRAARVLAASRPWPSALEPLIQAWTDATNPRPRGRRWPAVDLPASARRGVRERRASRVSLGTRVAS